MYIHNTIAGLAALGEAAEILSLEDSAQLLPRRSSPRNGSRPQRPWALVDSAVGVVPEPDGLQANSSGLPELKQGAALQGRAQEQLEQEEGLQNTHIAQDQVRRIFSRGE